MIRSQSEIIQRDEFGPSRHRCSWLGARSLPWLSLVLAPTLALGVGVAPGSTATPGPASQRATALDDQVGDAKAQLTAASKAAEEANRALERAEAKLRPAEAAVSRAQAKVSQAEADVATAEAAERKAREAVAAAKAKVEEQKKQIKLVEARIDEIIRQISGLARKAYMSGGEQGAIEFILQTEDPADFGLRMEAQRRASRANDALFDQATALRAELARQLAILRGLEEQARAQEAEAERQAQAAQAASDAANTARDAAAAAANEVRQLVAGRQQAADAIDARRRDAKRLYDRLLEQQARVQGISRTTGTIRSATEAVAWAMNWLGRGESYDGLCLGFVDDAYGAPGDQRQALAIDQWYRAKAAGKGHPGDTTPPIGAHVFWWSGNPARHIAIYAGNGMVISTGVDGDRVGLRSMDYFDSYGPYVGWAEPYYG